MMQPYKVTLSQAMRRMDAGLFHLHLRKRVDGKNKLAPYPHPNILVRFYDRAMYAVALLGPGAMLPQVFELFATKDVSGLSLAMWLLWQLSSILWFVYGILHKALPIIIAQVLYLVFQAIVIVFILDYN